MRAPICFQFCMYNIFAWIYSSGKLIMNKNELHYIYYYLKTKFFNYGVFPSDISVARRDIIGFKNGRKKCWPKKIQWTSSKLVKNSSRWTWILITLLVVGNYSLQYFFGKAFITLLLVIKSEMELRRVILKFCITLKIRQEWLNFQALNERLL